MQGSLDRHERTAVKSQGALRWLAFRGWPCGCGEVEGIREPERPADFAPVAAIDRVRQHMPFLDDLAFVSAVIGQVQDEQDSQVLGIDQQPISFAELEPAKFACGALRHALILEPTFERRQAHDPAHYRISDRLAGDR